nr:MAG TPA: NTP-PPase-like protein [Caudoviricetes sp.]
MITLEQRLNVLNSAIRTFGKENQKVVTIEELAELQKELTKDLRGKPNLQKSLKKWPT